MVENLSFNRFTSRYEPILEQCKWFIQGLHPDVVAGTNSCITLLFDMNRLFELYVGNVFKNVARANGYLMREQGPQKYMVRRCGDNQQLFIMKPDMVFMDDEKNYTAIADAKWKILDNREKKLGIAQSDLYQMAGYASRYKVNRLALVYPKQQWLQRPVDLQLQGTDANIKILPVDVTANRDTGFFPFWAVSNG